MSEPREAFAREDLHDLAVSIEGVAFEIEALNQTLRELLSVVEASPGAGLEVPPPSWVNEPSDVEGLDQGRSELRYPPPERDRMGSAAAVVVVTVFVTTIATFLVVLYVLS
jgi:hypothetical protein